MVCRDRTLKKCLLPPLILRKTKLSKEIFLMEVFYVFLQHYISFLKKRKKQTLYLINSLCLHNVNQAIGLQKQNIQKIPFDEAQAK